MIDKLGPFILGPTDDVNQGVYTGDARILSQAIPDESIDLIFTDPVYQNIDDYRWLAETATRILKPNGDVLVYFGMYHLGLVIQAMMNHLEYRWILIEKKMTGGTLIWSYGLFSHFVPVLWFTKGRPRTGPHRLDFKWSQGEGKHVNHRWSKGSIRSAYWLEKFGMSEDIVWDPFCGGGAIISACKLASRHWLAFEIDPDTAEAARQRIQQTQPPLPGLNAQQLELCEPELDKGHGMW